MATATPSPEPSAPPKRSLVPVWIVVGVIVVVIVGVAIWALSSDDDSSSSDAPKPDSVAQSFYAHWQDNDRAAAAKLGTPAAVNAIFAIPGPDGAGLTFGGCTTSDAVSTCSFTRPGGELKLTVATTGDTPTVTAATLGPTATTPTG